MYVYFCILLNFFLYYIRFLCFGLLVKQNDQFKEVTLAKDIVTEIFFPPFSFSLL